MPKILGGRAFIDSVKQLAQDASVLPMARIFKFGRRTRDYLRLYLSLGMRTGESALTHAEIEAQRKRAKTHRCCGEGADGAFCRDVAAPLPLPAAPVHPIPLPSGSVPAAAVGK